MIKILSKSLKAAIPWPSREEISRNLPKCFEGFENVRVVLDCTEIFIQHPANLCCQDYDCDYVLTLQGFQRDQSDDRRIPKW